MTAPARIRSPHDPGDPAPGARPDALGALAAATVAGDVAATRALVTALGPALLRVVRSTLGASHPEVEDVAQECVMGVLRALPTFRGECSVLHFACRVAVLTSMAARRRLRLRDQWHHDLASPDELAPAVEDPDEAGSPTAQIVAARRREILRALCDELPEPQSEALVLHCALGCSIEEIAAASGAPLNTVRSRLRLAKAALRARIEADPVLAEALEVRR